MDKTEIERALREDQQRGPHPARKGIEGRVNAATTGEAAHLYFSATAPTGYRGRTHVMVGTYFFCRGEEQHTYSICSLQSAPSAPGSLALLWENKENLGGWGEGVRSGP